MFDPSPSPSPSPSPGPWYINTLGGRLPKVMRRKNPHGEADTFYSTINDKDGKQVAVLDFGYGSKLDVHNAQVAAASKSLLDACKAVLDAIESADLNGAVLWIRPPYQHGHVHETASERLAAVIKEAETI